MKKRVPNNLPPVKQLALFVRKAKQLRQHSCFDFLSNYESSYSISWQAGSGMQINNLVKPEENAYCSYLMVFRQFLMNDSDTQVNKIVKMAVVRARHAVLRDRITELKDDLKEVNRHLNDLNRETEDGEVKISGLELFDLWLNGTLFHYDVEADELFASLGIVKDLIEVDFAKYVGLYSNFIMYLSTVVEFGLKTNGFDLLNKLSPYFDAKFVLEVSNEADKAAVFRFWEGTKSFAQTLAVCDEHDQDPVIVVSNYKENISDLQQVKIELKGCCKSAADAALARIYHSIAWINYMEKHGQPEQKEPIKILEVPVTDINDVQIIKAALDDYCSIWRRKIGRMRCSAHHMPPGARGFGVDLLLQDDGKVTDSVFLQGCCLPFIGEFLKKLKN